LKPDPVAPEDLLRARAYELYLQRGGLPGYETEDWNRARAELGGLEPSRN
jgi:hypothetical protein